MLKPVDQAEPPEPPSYGELAKQLVEDAKAYAAAEVELVKVIAGARARALILPAVLFGIAVLAALAGITALTLGVVLALAKFLGPLLAGVAGLLIFGAIAAGLSWYGAERVRRVL
jgi:hypothetical protein